MTAEAQYEVVVVGAGPAGMMAASLLGKYGCKVLVLEAEPTLIDYPRAVGLDDESLRAFQAAGVVGNLLEHTVPHQLLAFVDHKHRDLARLLPPASLFGWPRRNGFIQPLADRVLYEGLEAFENVTVQFDSRVTELTQDDEKVTVHYEEHGTPKTVTTQFAIGADGGKSPTRKSLGTSFEGSTAKEHWLVVDIRHDPIGRPGAWVIADRHRPYVNIGLPHGVRRFEFMLFKGETEQDVEHPEFIEKLVAPIVPKGTKLDIIRKRVYSHNSRIAGDFRKGRIFLAGDAAHLMSVWQGQGYNSGIRDSMNLAWKIAAVLKGQASMKMLDTYNGERRDHAKAMINLSATVGKMVSLTNPLATGFRDVFFRSIGIFPKIKRYILEMRFKPMPKISNGAVTFYGTDTEDTPVGKLFMQPTVATLDSPSIKLDDAIGPWFAVLAWNNDPSEILDEEALELLKSVGANLVCLRPLVQLHWNKDAAPDHIVGDIDGSLQRWFNDRPESVLLLRPDRIVGGASQAYAASEMVKRFFKVLQQ